jgi:hypothetical protein
MTRPSAMPRPPSMACHRQYGLDTPDRPYFQHLWTRATVSMMDGSSQPSLIRHSANEPLTVFGERQPDAQFSVRRRPGRWASAS